MATRTPARTVSKSLGKSFKNILDLPFKLKWPTVSPETTSEILAELVRSLDGVKVATANLHRKRRKYRNVSEEKETAEDNVPVAKRQCLDVGEGAKLSTSSEQEATSSPAENLNSAIEAAAVKRSQIVVGLKEVTKALEKGALRAAVVCLSAKPPLLHHHIQILAATRGVPCIALHGVSDAIAPVLGLRSALIFGLKNICTTATVDHFSVLATLISTRAPEIDIPWLHALPPPRCGAISAGNVKAQVQDITVTESKSVSKATKGEKTQQADHEVSRLKVDLPIIDDAMITSPTRDRYFPVAIKKTIITPKKRKR